MEEKTKRKIEEVSEVLDEIMETHNWIWKAVRAKRDSKECSENDRKTIKRTDRGICAGRSCSGKDRREHRRT